MPELTLPATFAEWLPLMTPLLTLAAGILFFIAPARMLAHLGLAGSHGHPEAVGEGRSRFAGFLLGLSVSALMFGQPVLFQVIGIGWGLAAAGKLVHVVFDGARRASVFLRLGLAAGLGAMALTQSGRPAGALVVPVSTPEWIVAGVAAVTALLGALAFLLPSAVLRMMRLVPALASAKGELRGSLAGFHLAAGLAALALGGVFVQLALGAAWLFTAFGRMISMLSDGANNLRNWIVLVVELALGALPLGVVFGILQ